nr:mannosyltransferase [Winogradskyella marina]
MYLWFAYAIVRTNTIQLLFAYVLLFAFAYKIISSSEFNSSKFKLLVVFSIVLRLLFLFATPNLSQDFYRFIWDGRMILEGFNPYLYTPDSFMDSGKFPVAQAQELYNGMGELSASHYTNYPPINQVLFTVAALFSGHSILGSAIVMRLIIIVADIGTLYFGKKLLERLNLPSKRIFWYILNPFIIIELTGNLHFEGVMIFFLIWSLYLLHSGKWKWAAVVFACSISVKLIPLMLLPLFFGWFRKNSVISNDIEKPKKPFIPTDIGSAEGDIPVNLNLSNKDASTALNMPSKNKTSKVFKTIKVSYQKLITFYIIIGLTTLLLFLPFFSMEFVTNYSKTVGLWFGNFEFNASIYYLARAIGYAQTGYNEIAIIGKILPVISVLIILGLSIFKPNNSLPKLMTSMLLALSFYLFLSTTVHPWYIATLVVLSLFTNYKFPLVWSLVVVLSYLAYSNTDNSENLWIIAIEYVIVFSVFIWEVILKKRLPVS